MNANPKKVSFSCASDIVRQYGKAKIQSYAAQNDNPLLKACASEVIEVFDAGSRS